MATIADLIDDIRIEIVDASETLWDDADLVKVIAKSVRRVAHVLRRHEIPFAREYYTITTESGTSEYDLPSDFMAPVGLFRDATNVEMIHLDDRAFEKVSSASPLAAYCIRDGQVVVDSAPASGETLTLIYWPEIDTSEYATTTTTPWSGRLDDAIAEYCAIRCKNIDEMDFSMDAQLMKDLEGHILATYGTLNPTMGTMRGWMGGSNG